MMSVLGKGVRIVKRNSKFILLGTGIFLISILIGYLNAEEIQKMASELMKELEQIARKINENNSPLYTFWVIFQNNLLASLSMLGLGIFLGFYPALALLSNGILLGFMLKISALKGINPFSVFFLGILPHGIFELFAVIVAASIGMKYGILIIRMLANLANNSRRSRLVDDFKTSLNELPYIVGAIVVLLLLAAVIESTVTPLLINSFLGDQMVS
ncbi:stage II sporulation protein M [Ammoniphilus resinae]|uniref:Stage II sporulation protein M n=1 Tax=Ammoniphilus resinae TaxID=861532 RepID=A0ABS4GS31_9BACL|nr:stage II sporulation protein M [Ammoniphilus resinae]MBP1933071.1 stage II sporulation protein M [Ammoniphilus resinae]